MAPPPVWPRPLCPDRTMPFVDRGFPVDVTFSSCQAGKELTMGRRQRGTEREKRKETGVGQLISEREAVPIFPEGPLFSLVDTLFQNSTSHLNT